MLEMRSRGKSDLDIIEHSSTSISARDQATLRRLGKQPVLKRNFGFLSILGFTSIILLSWEGILITIQYGLVDGGPAGTLYEYLYIWLGVMASFVVVGELASMAPVSGGQYHWVSMLAPPSIHTFLSYITGWLTVFGWQGNTATTVYFSSTLIQGLASLTRPNYVPQPWHQILIALAVILFAILINTRGGSVLPRFEGSMLVLHIIGLFAILIPLLTLSEHQSATEVFTTFANSGNLPTQGVSFLVGTIGVLVSFVGADGAIHMAEEIENAAIIVPRAIVSAYLLNGILALAVLLGTLFCVQDISTVLTTPTQYPFINIFLQGTGSIAGATTMTAIITVLQISAAVASLAGTSRQLWAFSRDRGIPGWRHISQVEAKTSVPMNAVFTTAAIAMLLQLINLGSSTAFNDLTSITVAGLYSSYLIAVSFLLYRRCTGDISLFHHGSSSSSDPYQPQDLTNTINAPLSWGPWHVPGVAGITLNVLVCAFLLTAWFFSFWPTALPVTAESMNYNCVLWGGVVLISLIYYGWRGRKEYTGPIIEVEREL